jgi:hypothetical protein
MNNLNAYLLADMWRARDPQVVDLSAPRPKRRRRR